MQKEDLKKRWQEQNCEAYLKRISLCFAKGDKIAENLSPFGLHEGRIDFRGLTITPEQRTNCTDIIKCHFNGGTIKFARSGQGCTHIIKCRFNHVDFTDAIFGDVWTEGCEFKDVVFGKADMQGFRDHGNRYQNCLVIKTDFSYAGIGYKGSRYDECVFRDAKFRKTGFIRPQFDNCLFDDCKLHNAEFDASSFENCTFVGKLYGVCFSNGYFFGEMLNKRFGVPRKNRMHNVSFAKAELKTVGFRWGCDLSTVIMPESGEYRRYNNLAKRLQTLRNKLSEFPEDARKKIDKIFIGIYLRTAADLNQDMYIFNCDEIRKEYGEANGQKMIDILDHSI
jgi:fluoroquinolone resistance protein